jgi:hypothetical protein
MLRKARGQSQRDRRRPILHDRIGRHHDVEIDAAEVQRGDTIEACLIENHHPSRDRAPFERARFLLRFGFGFGFAGWGRGGAPLAGHAARGLGDCLLQSAAAPPRFRLFPALPHAAHSARGGLASGDEFGLACRSPKSEPGQRTMHHHACDEQEGHERAIRPKSMHGRHSSWLAVGALLF